MTLKKLKENEQKTNSNIYHFENYIQIQKLNYVLKIRFNNDELNPQAENIKTHHAMGFTVRPGYSLCSHTEKVREMMFINVS